MAVHNGQYHVDRLVFHRARRDIFRVHGEVYEGKTSITPQRRKALSMNDVNAVIDFSFSKSRRKPHKTMAEEVAEFYGGGCDGTPCGYECPNNMCDFMNHKSTDNPPVSDGSPSLLSRAKSVATSFYTQMAENYKYL